MPAHRPRATPSPWWLVAPCALTLPAAGFGLLVAFVADAFSCFDTCVSYSWWFNTTAGVTTLFAAELVLSMAAIVILITGLVEPRWRHFLVRTAWGAFLLACAGIGLLFWYPR